MTRDGGTRREDKPSDIEVETYRLTRSGYLIAIANFVIAALLCGLTAWSTWVTSDAFEASQRPFLLTEHIQTVTDTETELVIGVLIKNWSDVPALDVDYDVSISLDDHVFPVSHDDPDISFALAPGDTKVRTGRFTGELLKHIRSASKFEVIVKCTYKSVTKADHGYSERRIWIASHPGISKPAFLTLESEVW